MNYIALQAPLSMGCSRQEYWSGLLFPSPGHLPNLGIEPAFPALAAQFFTAEQPGCSLKVKVKVAQSHPTLFHPMDCNLCPWNSPGRNTGMGCHFLLHGIFSTQRSNPCLPHCRQMLYHLSHQGSHFSIPISLLVNAFQTNRMIRIYRDV